MSTMDLSVIVSAIDKYSEPARRISAITDKMGKHFEAGQKALKGLYDKGSQVQSLQRLQKQLGHTAAQVDIAKRNVAALGREIARTDKPTAQQIRRFDTAKRALNRLTNQHHTQKQALIRLRSELKGAGIDIRNLGSASAGIERKVAAVTQQMEKMALASARVEKAQARFDRASQIAANTALIAGGIERVGRGMLNALVKPTQQFISFESAMADVRKVVEFKEADGLQKLSTRLIEMTRYIPIAKEGLAAIAAAGGQLGVDEHDLPQFVNTVAKASVAFDMLPDAAGEAMAKLSNVYQIPITEMTELGDAINHLSDNTAAKSSEIVSALLRVGGNARQFGLLPTQTAALADSFIALGKRPEVAGTAINAMLTKMQTATKQMGQFQDGLEVVGVSAEDLEHAIAEDAQGALMGFLQKLAQLDKQTRAGVLSQLFGLEYADDISLLAGSLGQYQKALALTGNQAAYAGSMEREFVNRSNTTENRIQLLNQRWQAVQQTVGEKVIPILEQLMGAFEPVLDWIGSIVKAFPTASKVVLGLIGVVGGIAVVTAPVVTAITSLMVAMALLGKTAAKTRSSVATAAAANAIGGGVMSGKKGRLGKLTKGTGVLAAAGGALSLFDTWSSDKQTGDKVDETIESVGGLGGMLGGAKLGAWMGSVVPGIGTAIGGVVGGAAGYFLGGSIGDWLGDFFKSDPTEPTAIAADVGSQHKTVQKTTTINAPITVQAAANPEQTAQAINQHMTQLAHDSMRDDED